MFITTFRVGKQTSTVASGSNVCDSFGHLAAEDFGEAISPTMTKRSRLQLYKKCRLHFNLWALWKFILLINSVMGVFLGARTNAKGCQRNLQAFFGIVDQDGNGEIEQGEASKFLRKLDVQMTDVGGMETKEGMSERMASSQFAFNFSYGGGTISAEEMLDHLSDMMTANHVVNWITHGLELPQYAEAFRQNAINGMDFPALIENDSEALLQDLGIKSTLHRTKITHALVRQIFGIGIVPGPIRSLQCYPSSCGGIQLSWEDPINRGVPPLHKYLIERWSKTLSTWTNVADTSEVAFMDRNDIKLGKYYTYRVQSWGNHGPSNWVTVDGCRKDFTHSSSELDIEDTLPLQMAGQVSASLGPELMVPRAINSSQEEKRGIWTCINSGVILFLAFFSRHTFFYDITLAAWVLLLNHLRQILRQGLDSPYLSVKLVARSISLACESWCYMRHKVWMLSRFGVDPSLDSRRVILKSLSEPCSKSPYEGAGDLNGGYFDTQSIQSTGADDVSETSSVGLQTSLGGWSGSSLNGSGRDSEFHDMINKAVLFPPSTPPQDAELHPIPSKRSKSRCNHEGCKVRFDRWRSLQDWWMKLNKHYCRECQSVYCVKHTRISPHGPRGQCGLESSCYCYNCFANLTPEFKCRLEEQNRLRVGPFVSSDSLSSSSFSSWSSTSSPSLWASSSSSSWSSSSPSSSSGGSSKQRYSSSSNTFRAGAGLPPPLSDTAESDLDSNRLLDSRGVVSARFVGASNAATDSGVPENSTTRVVSRDRYWRSRSFA